MASETSLSPYSRLRSASVGFSHSSNVPAGQRSNGIRSACRIAFATSSGITVYDDFRSATDCSASRYHFGNVFADCEIDKLWDTDGRLFVSGYHHDGRVEVELRQLTDEGDIFFPEEGVSAMGSTYRDGDESRFIHDLWDSPEMCVTPRFMERCFGAAAQERGSGERDHAVEAGAPEPPVPVTEPDMEDRGDAR